MDHRDRRLGEDGGENGGLLERASRLDGRTSGRSVMMFTSPLLPLVSTLSVSPTHFTDGEEDSLEKGRRLVECLLESLVELVVELAIILGHVVTDALEENSTEKDGRLFGLEVGNKDLGRRVGRMRGPVGRRGDGEEARPLGKRGEKLERLRERPRTVSREKLPNSEGRARARESQLMLPARLTGVMGDQERLTSCTQRRPFQADPLPDLTHLLPARIAHLSDLQPLRRLRLQAWRE